MGEALLIDNEESFTPPPSVDPPPRPSGAARYHTPVLLEESMRALAVKPGGRYVDCTLGGGGHFQALVDRLGAGGLAIGVDRDPDAIAWCEAHVRRGEAAVVIRQRRFSRFYEVLDELRLADVDGVLLDLGVSSRQLFAEKRGFSYMRETALDMRMDPSDARTAADILQSSSTADLARILSEYGEIRNPLRMAETIKRCEKSRRLRTSGDLKDCLRQEYGATLNVKMLAKLFQALRIAVNDELAELRDCCERATAALGQGGRLVVISYHSLEDRFVKNFMRDNEKGCMCPPSVPVCVCGKVQTLKRITHKAIMPSSLEVNVNPASRSARLRAAEKITVTAVNT
jgi:16S rRNA (cytosine1402-N4)-methyltransferase